MEHSLSRHFATATRFFILWISFSASVRWNFSFLFRNRSFSLSCSIWSWVRLRLAFLFLFRSLLRLASTFALHWLVHLSVTSILWWFSFMESFIAKYVLHMLGRRFSISDSVDMTSDVAIVFNFDYWYTHTAPIPPVLHWCNSVRDEIRNVLWSVFIVIISTTNFYHW